MAVVRTECTWERQIVDVQVGVPAPVGMICVGLFLNNVGNAVLISGLKTSWSKEIRGAALAIIFLRSGLELDLQVPLRDANLSTLSQLCQCITIA